MGVCKGKLLQSCSWRKFTLTLFTLSLFVWTFTADGAVLIAVWLHRILTGKRPSAFVKQPLAMGQSKSKKVDCTSTTGAIGLGKEFEKLKICTYNVHMWMDARNYPNTDLVVNLISELQPGVLCLQVFSFLMFGWCQLLGSNRIRGVNKDQNWVWLSLPAQVQWSGNPDKDAQHFPDGRWGPP